MFIFQKEALDMMKNIIHWMREDDSALGREKLPGQTAASSLAEPMMLCCLLDQLQTMDPSVAPDYSELSKWCVQQIFSHVQVRNYSLTNSVVIGIKQVVYLNSN